MIYCAPNINKYIVNLWKLIAYLESTSMNGFQFSKHLHFSSYGISIAKFVPLLAEVAETTYFQYSHILITILCYNSIFSRLMAQLVQVYFKLLKYFCPISVVSVKKGYAGMENM